MVEVIRLSMTDEIEKPKNWIDEMIEMEAVPKSVREETVVDFCKRHGIADRTYYYQARNPENQKKILELTLNLAKNEVPEILRVLTENAKAGKEKSIEMYLDYVLKLAKNLDIKSDGKPIPIYGGQSTITVQGHDSNKEDIPTEEKN